MNAGRAQSFGSRRRINWTFYGSQGIFPIAANGAPVVAVCTIGAQGTDAVLVNSDSSITTLKAFRIPLSRGVKLAGYTPASWDVSQRRNQRVLP